MEHSADGSRVNAKTWLKCNLHVLEPELHVQIHPRIQPGSINLQTLLSRGTAFINWLIETNRHISTTPDRIDR
jgi:S-adenosylmethionine synthetase